MSSDCSTFLVKLSGRSPITMMRNELISQGGSGVPINKEAYMHSVNYWKDHAVVQ